VCEIFHKFFFNQRETFKKFSMSHPHHQLLDEIIPDPRRSVPDDFAISAAVDAAAVRKSIVEKHGKRLFGGSALIKKCRNARQHLRWIAVSQDMQQFKWAKSKNDMEDLKSPKYKAIPSKNIKQVREICFQMSINCIFCLGSSKRGQRILFNHKGSQVYF
jgi:hypothetical protein